MINLLYYEYWTDKQKYLYVYIKLCYVYVKFNEPIIVAHLQKLATQPTFNGALRNGNWFFRWKPEKLWSFNKARNVLIEKMYILLDFARSGKEQQSC